MKVLRTILLCCLIAALPVSAATKRPVKKSAASSSSKAKKTATVKKSAGTSKKKSTASSRRRGSRTTARRSGPPRQSAPTPERYIEIQQALVDKGYYNGPVDGRWTPECVLALKKFQGDQSLQPDGKLGALSLIALGLGPKREPVPTQFLSKPEAETTQSPN